MNHRGSLVFTSMGSNVTTIDENDSFSLAGIDLAVLSPTGYEFFILGGELDSRINAYFILLFAQRYLPKPKFIDWGKVRAIDFYNYAYAYHRLFYQVNYDIVHQSTSKSKLKQIDVQEIVDYIERMDAYIPPVVINTGANDNYDILSLLRSDVVHIWSSRKDGDASKSAVMREPTADDLQMFSNVKDSDFVVGSQNEQKTSIWSRLFSVFKSRE